MIFFKRRSAETTFIWLKNSGASFYKTFFLFFLFSVPGLSYLCWYFILLINMMFVFFLIVMFNWFSDLLCLCWFFILKNHQITSIAVYCSGICKTILPFGSQTSHGHCTCGDNIRVCWSFGIKRFQWKLKGGWSQWNSHNAKQETYF